MFEVNVVWHKDGVITTVKQFRHLELPVVIGRATAFAKLSARANAVQSPETHGQYTVEYAGSVYYDSTKDGNIAHVKQTHNRSKV